MRKTFRKVAAVIAVVGCLCTSVAAEECRIVLSEPAVEESMVMRATGSFSMTIKADTKVKGDKEFSLAAGESVQIYATYAPSSASVYFGLVDPAGTFHYLSAKDGTFDETFTITESGNYKLGVKNASSNEVRVSGFVKY